jgi:hypothetical protein
LQQQNLYDPRSQANYVSDNENIAGPYAGQAMVPQELHGPYYPTFINAPPTEDGGNHYWISFSYGSRLGPGLKQAIFDALPKQDLKPVR